MIKHMNMNTFDIYKSNYIKARLRYMNAKEKYRQYKEFNDSDPTLEEKTLYERYKLEKWEQFIDVTHAADMMGEYIAKCAMAQIKDEDLMCLIVGENLVEDSNETYFEFIFKFLPTPTLERLTECEPVLNELCDRIYFGFVDADEAKKELEEAGVTCGEVTTISGYSENDILRPPFEEVVGGIHDLAVAAIDGFRSKSR